MYDDILLPTDGSGGLKRVIDHASALAAIHDAMLHGLYVVDTASLTDVPMEITLEGVDEALREEGETALTDLERLAEGVPVETDIAEGTPAQEIIGYAREEPVDVIVMGTHGRSGVDRLLLGSVAERIVRSSPVPVLTVGVDGRADDADE
jgi:nucleotide-binding universal stress UspA family protein